MTKNRTHPNANKPALTSKTERPQLSIRLKTKEDLDLKRDMSLVAIANG